MFSTTYRFRFSVQPSWPSQAWLARWVRGSEEIEVLHGSRVETLEHGFGELIWDGDFAEHDFDQTDIVFGSGARARTGRLTFVASSNTLDRLVSAEFGNQLFISNSLACLTQNAGASFDPWYANYPNDFTSIIKGPDAHVSRVPTSRGPIRLTYFHNLVFDGKRLHPEPKPIVQRNRTSFDQYQEFLQDAVGRCFDNMRDAGRKHTWQLMGTLSTGFDSTTVAALARPLGLSEAMTLVNARGGASDCGAAIGQALGLDVHEIPRDAWQSYRFSEIPFVAADAKGEDVYFRGAGELLRNRVLLTGFTGSIWGGRSSNYLNWIRTDQSGLSLTEYRLHLGVINMPIPTIGVYQSQDLLELMGSEEARSWASGNAYDKPFCRKVLSDAGVPGDLYGNEKKAASVLLEDRGSFLSEDSRLDFEAYLHQLFGNHPGRATRYRAARSLGMAGRRCVGAAQGIAEWAGRTMNLQICRRMAQSVRLTEYAASEPNYRFLFPWAIRLAQQAYRLETADDQTT